jgi:hypothetical protein
MTQKPERVTITPDHYASVFVNSDGQYLILHQDQDGPPILFEDDDHPVNVEDIRKLPGSATTWVAGGLILANDEGIWLKTSILAADRWLRRAA